MKILSTLFFAVNAQIFTPGGKCPTVPVIADFDAGKVGFYYQNLHENLLPFFTNKSIVFGRMVRANPISDAIPTE